MFPITDPSRAADIRMRRRRAVGLLAGIVVVGCLLAGGPDKPRARAEDKTATDVQIDPGALSISSNTLPATQIAGVLHQIPLIGRLDWTVRGAALPTGRRDAAALSADGATLTVNLPCANSVTLVPQSDLSRRVFVSGGNDRPAAPDLKLTGAGETIALTGGCERHGGDVVVQAPAWMPITLTQAGSTDLRLGRFTAPIHLSLHGSGDTVIDGAGAIDGSMAGSGDLLVGTLNGNLRMQTTGSGDLGVGHIHAASVEVQSSGSGDVRIEAGRIDRFAAIMRGSGDLAAKAEIGDAMVQAGEDSDITLPHVKGRLDRRGLSEGP